MLSKTHIEVSDFLSKNYPYLKVLKEFLIIDNLRLDFYLPEVSLAIEIDGLQHDKYVEFFHKNYDGFLNSVANDKKKESFLKKNNISLIRFKTEEFDKDYLNNVIYNSLVAEENSLSIVENYYPRNKSFVTLKSLKTIGCHICKNLLDFQKESSDTLVATCCGIDFFITKKNKSRYFFYEVK